MRKASDKIKTNVVVDPNPGGGSGGNPSEPVVNDKAFKTLEKLPQPALEYYKKIIFIKGDAFYGCVSNVENPTANSQVFWVQI